MLMKAVRPSSRSASQASRGREVVDREPIVMPKLGLTMQEGLLSTWLVKPGSTVRRGDVMFVVETDKISNEIEAAEDGRIEEIIVAEGQTVPVGAVLARWSESEALPRAQAESATVASATPSSASGAAPRTISTPLARRLAREAGIDIRTVGGSGSRGRVMAADIAAIRKMMAAEGSMPAMPAVEAPISTTDGARSPRRISRLRKLTAQRLALSKQTIPHFYLMAEADVTGLEKLRLELNDISGSPRLSISHFVVHAAGRALKSMPEMNAVWADESVQDLNSVDVGIAVETKAGVVAPLLRSVGHMTLDETTEAASKLIAAARDGKLGPDELAGGAFTVSNVGMFGASYLVPIISPGQSMILGVGAIRKVFRPDDQGMPVLSSELGLVLSCDHRVFDGVAAARFLNTIKSYLEKPLALLRKSS